MDDEADILEFIHSLDDIKSRVKQRDELLESNLAKVNENLRKKEEFDRIVEEHQEEIAEIENLTTELGALMKDVESVQKQYSPEKVMEKLKEMETGCSKEASEILKRFMKKEMSLEDFIAEYQIPVKRVKFIQLARGVR